MEWHHNQINQHSNAIKSIGYSANADAMFSVAEKGIKDSWEKEPPSVAAWYVEGADSRGRKPTELTIH